MKFIKYISFFFLIFFTVTSSAQNYSIDDSRADKKNRMPLSLKIKLKIRSWLREDKQKKADKKKNKQMELAEKNQKKGVLRYQKRQGKDKEITSRERVWKRIKKMKKQSARVNKNKTRENFFRRLFIKNKQRPAKFKK